MKRIKIRKMKSKTSKTVEILKYIEKTMVLQNMKLL